MFKSTPELEISSKHHTFSNKPSKSPKDSSFPTAYIIYSHISRNPLEVYPRTIVHMLTSVKAAENRADSLISWAFLAFTLLWTTPFHTSKGVQE